MRNHFHLQWHSKEDIDHKQQQQQQQQQQQSNRREGKAMHKMKFLLIKLKLMSSE